MNWHRLSVAETFELLDTGKDGLSSTKVEANQLEFGSNELKEGKRRSYLSIFLGQFKDLMILILLAATVISGFLGEATDAIVILVIVFRNAIIGFFQEYHAEKAFHALKKMAETKARVIREGKSNWIPSKELVPGDLVILESGNAVPADMRITESINLKIEEASLTGESHPVEKITQPLKADDMPLGDKKNMAFKGTFVSYGRGSGIVIATGMKTELGKIAKMLQEKEALTPLQIRMLSLSKRLSILILILCILFFVSGRLRGEDLIKLMLTSISMAVAAIPEALPAVITISLAMAARSMIKYNCLIRKLPAVETLGSITYICTDKTGTLTKNKMNVENIFTNGLVIERPDIEASMQHENMMLLLQSFALNNDTFLDNENKLKGDSTEIALREVSNELKIDPTKWPRLSEIAFDSERKMMTTYHAYDDKFISFTKGAPEILLKHCSGINVETLKIQVDEMAAKGHRIIGFACRYWDKLPENHMDKIHETELIFLGFAGIIDPPREEVYEAVAQCKQAGIVPVMITGDHPLTAKNIAQRIGILNNENDLLVTGNQLLEMDHEQFMGKVEKIKVYARVSPEQKLNIVKILQQKGQYVAMTGDGVNDAPALKRANIGIAMGITGTDVSREAAHMILLDDNFSTIVKAIKEGRRIYDNILKFIKYLTTTNAGELATLFIGPIVGLPLALLPIHILWINLISDGLPAISLSFEKSEENIMNRPPRPPQESVFANGRGMHIIWVGLLMAGIALATQYIAIKNNLHWQTIVFNVLCLTQLGHVLAIKSEKKSLFSGGFLSNIPLIAAVLLSIMLQGIVTYTPFFQPIFKTESLTPLEFVFVVGSSTVVLFAVEIEKAVNKKKH